MKRFIVPSFIVVLCLHAAILIVVMNLKSQIDLRKTSSLDKGKTKSLSIWDIYQRKDKKPEFTKNVISQKETVPSPSPSPVMKKTIAKSVAKTIVKTEPKKLSVVKTTVRKLKTNQAVKRKTRVTQIKKRTVEVESRPRFSHKLLKRKYQLELLKLINSRIEYPNFAKRMEHEGIVKIKLGVLENGAFFLVQVYLSSNHESLDENAIELVKSLSLVVENKLNKRMLMIIPVEYNL